MSAPHIRIVLLGKTGVGKSSLVNTILGETMFGMSRTADSETSECQTETREVHGRTITVTDTPGFFDSKKSEKKMKSAIVKCITDCSPGPHAFLILLKVETFTDQENEVISKIKNSFSEEAFKHAVVVFTHGDQLQDGMKIEEFVGKNEKLRDLLKKCGDRCHVVDNKYWKNNQDKYRNNQVQVSALLNTVDKMVMENNMFPAVERLIQEAEQVIRQTGAENMSDEEVREQAKRNVKENIMKKTAAVTAGVFLGALLGVPLMVASIVKFLMKLPAAITPVITAAGTVMRAVGAAETAAAGGAAGAAGGAAGAAAVGVITTETAVLIGAVAGVVAGVAGVAGAVVGGRTGYEEADNSNSVREAVKNTAAALCNKVAEPFKELAKPLQKTEEDHQPQLKE